MQDKKKNEDMEITYTLCGDYYLPDLAVPQENAIIGRFGQAHLKHIRKHRVILYTNLLTSGKLITHLAQVDEQAQQQYDFLMGSLEKQEDITEELKENDQMEWIRRKNMVHLTVMEIINRELIYI